MVCYRWSKSGMKVEFKGYYKFTLPSHLIYLLSVWIPHSLIIYLSTLRSAALHIIYLLYHITMSYNYNAITPDADNATAGMLVGANTTAIFKSKDASRAMQMGRFEESISLHREALELKLRAYPESSIQAAITHNGLGEALLRAGRLDEADEVLQKALAVRERGGPDLDAAATRENIGALREAQGRFGEARDVRLRGAEAGHMLCSDEHCPKTEMLP
ncbi:hypothetical protein F4782DRAFT_488727 [Xylaria castorea]|nr:hypothetical protein F4782DRAFT_488727 [Xylaria castorea]